MKTALNKPERPRKKRKLDSSNSLKNKGKSKSPGSIPEPSKARVNSHGDEVEVIEDSEDELVKWVPSSDPEENEAETSREHLQSRSVTKTLIAATTTRSSNRCLSFV